MTDMAWAVFKREIHMSGTQRKPRSVFGFGAHPSDLPQQFPREFIDYAVSCGAAEEVPSPSKQDAPVSVVKRTRKGHHRAE